MALKPTKKAVLAKIRDEPLPAILGRDLEWFDYAKLDRQKRRDYCAAIVSFARSKEVENELKSLLFDLRDQGFFKAQSYEELLILRHQYQGAENFLKRLRTVAFVDEKETMEDLNSEI